MNVKDIVIKTSELLKLDDIINYFSDEENNSSSEILNEVNDLLLAVNMCNSVIASQYFEITETKSFAVTGGVIKYSSFDKNLIEIKDVFDENGNSIDYSLDSAGINIAISNSKIKYSFFPNNLVMTDSIDYYTKLNVMIFAVGVAGEYLFLKGDMEESNIWEEKFKSLLFGLSRPKRGVTIPKERWL